MVSHLHYAVLAVLELLRLFTLLFELVGGWTCRLLVGLQDFLEESFLPGRGEVDAVQRSGQLGQGFGFLGTGFNVVDDILIR